jgi:hypothetical protein
MNVAFWHFSDVAFALRESVRWGIADMAPLGRLVAV